uniref:HCO3_cotransp domain-containing protein n=1 Tax=Macrostomum lignano TaxID=282301 RepID=A0A1I8F737_9PLAT
RLDTGDAPHPAQPRSRATRASRPRARQAGFVGQPRHPGCGCHAGLLMAAGADGAARQQQGIRFDIRAGGLKIPLKDFSSEIRANMDIQRFLKEATLLLDVEGANVECIIEQMLRSIFRADHESHHSSGSGGGGGDGGSVAGAAGAIDSRLDAKVQDAKKDPANWMDYTYQRLAKTIKSISVVDSEGLITDNSWLCTMCSLNGVQKRHVAIARLSTPGESRPLVRGRQLHPAGGDTHKRDFVKKELTGSLQKGTKSDIELGRTFATILADSEFRQKLLLAETESEFKEMLQGHAHELGEEQKIYRRKSLRTKDFMSQAFNYESSWPICNGIRADLKRRLSHYLSDFIDAVHRVILSQCIGGVTFALFGGQPLIIMLTTAPLALYTH